jgi:hypothetical protein
LETSCQLAKNFVISAWMPLSPGSGIAVSMPDSSR